VTRADACATARDGEGYAGLFTDDATLTGDVATAGGRKALQETVSRVWAAEPPGTIHVTTNAIVDDSGSEPAVESTLLLVAPGTPTPIITTAQIRQVVSRTAAGWRIRSRTIQTLGQPRND
jgi:SnoaL-like domain